MSEGPRILVVEARFYTEIADALVEGATAEMTANGAVIDRLSVPGALEIPGAIRFAAEGGRIDPTGAYDGFVALGCVIRGETTHYDYVCQESARGVQDLVLHHMLAIGNGILTVESRDQAMVRADPARKNKGRDAAHAALTMVELKRRFGLA